MRPERGSPPRNSQPSRAEATSESQPNPFSDMRAWIVLVAGILTSLSWDEAS